MPDGDQIMQLEDYYEILGVAKDANDKDIKKAFRKLSRKHHPDVSSDKNANEIFSKISESYEVLKDEKKRKLYDRYGKEGLEESGRGRGGGGGNPFDVFSSFFDDDGEGGFFGGGRRQGSRKPRPLVIEFFVDLELIQTGGKVNFTHFGSFKCPHCDGSGADDPNDVHVCSECRGKGRVMKVRQLAPGYVQHIQGTCPKCNGQGKIFKSKCHVCSGEKTLKGVKEDMIWVEKGSPDGTVITVEGAAKDSVDEGEESTDVVVVVRRAKHPFYRNVQGSDDLHCTIDISLEEALLGYKKKIRNLSGEYFRIEEKSIWDLNQKRRMRNKGLPKHNSGGDHGDLIIDHVMSMPSDEEVEKNRQLWEDFFA
jgi:DnaJ-related protein SCJ1